MKTYTLNFLDRLEVVVLSRALQCADDLAALSAAEKASTTHAIEVWHGERRVALVKKGNAPLLTGDRQSL